MANNPQTTPHCSFCSAEAAALLDMPGGCLCSDTRYQYRCVQHMMRATDTSEVFSLVTTFPDFVIVQKVMNHG